jgi:hypothetical protein
LREVISNEFPGGKKWVTVPGLDKKYNKWSWVSIGENGDMWLLEGTEKRVYKVVLSSNKDEKAKGIMVAKAISGSGFKQMDAGKDQLFAVDVHNQVFGRKDYSGELKEGSSDNDFNAMWEQLGGSMSFVSTAEERILWGLDSDG